MNLLNIDDPNTDSGTMMFGPSAAPPAFQTARPINGDMATPAPAPGNPGTDSILSTILERMNEQDAQRKLDMQAAQDQSKHKAIKELLPAGIAAIIAGLFGGKNRGAYAGAAFNGALTGINAAKQKRDATLAAQSAAAMKASDERRNMINKAMTGLAMEREKARLKSQYPSTQGMPAGINEFRAIYGRNPMSADEYNTFLRGRRPASELTTDRLASEIFQRYQTTGKLSPADKAILDTIVRMRTYPSLAPGAMMGLYNLPSATAGMGGNGGGLTPP